MAVVGVMLYHAGVKWVPGGLLGVDVFFVLSGFLITSLLLRELAGTGRISLRAFWARRARRLLPALLLVLLAVSLWASLDPAQDVKSIRVDVAAALGYVANWRFAFSHQGYFSSNQTPSPVLHLWSLGVEEQFYLCWPLLVAGAVLLWRRVAPRWGLASDGRFAVWWLAVIGAAASTALLVTGSLRGTDPSRLYYGTDTRALALLTGAVLATRLPLPRSPEAGEPGPRPDRWWPISGALALGGLVLIFMTVGGQDRLLYRGGFLGVALVVATLLASLVKAPHSRVSRLLGAAPLVHLGRISYGLYLWHWPVILFATASRTGLHGLALLVFRLLLSFALAELSYRLAERPILQGTFPARRLATASLVTLVGLAVATSPWAAVAREAGAGNGQSLASKLDTYASQQEKYSKSLTQRRVSAVTSGSSSTGSPANPTGSGSRTKERPVTVVLFGDSTAWTAGLALLKIAPLWNVNLINASHVGCGLGPGVGAGAGDQAPVRYGECWTWPQDWQQTVQVQRPDISLVVLGRWETVNRRVGNAVVHIGQPAFDSFLKAAFERAMGVLTSAGGKVALATAPCYQRPERPDGTRWPQDDCRRVQAFNTIIRAVAAEFPSKVSVLDLYKFFSPDGKWHLDIGGHQVRDVDGIHFNIDGGRYLAPVFLGNVRQMLGLLAFPSPGA